MSSGGLSGLSGLCRVFSLLLKILKPCSWILCEGVDTVLLLASVEPVVPIDRILHLHNMIFLVFEFIIVFKPQMFDLFRSIDDPV